MEFFRCPICGLGLAREERTYRCQNGHAFDRSSRNYVNLLMSNAQGKRHGDDKLMVQARAAFLSRGHYDGISQAVCRMAERYAPTGGVLIDCGCGEGKYTKDISDCLNRSGKHVRIYGMDISKTALFYAGKRCQTAEFSVASAANMPFFDASADVICELFSFFAAEEFHRVLKPGGVVIEALPRQRHLIELKEAIYDRAYLNPPPDFDRPGFTRLETAEVDYGMQLDCGEDIENLFKMTPYYYKTGAADQRKLGTMTRLTVTVSVAVTAYRRTEGVFPG